MTKYAFPQNGSANKNNHDEKGRLNIGNRRPFFLSAFKAYRYVQFQVIYQ